MIAKKTLLTLEFDRILERLGGYTSFSLSRERALALLPDTNLATVAELQAQVSESWRLLDSRADVSLGRAHDIRQVVTRASLGGTLDPSQLLDVLSTIDCADRIRSALSKLAVEEFPFLCGLRTKVLSFRDVATLIAQTVSAQGEI